MNDRTDAALDDPHLWLEEVDGERAMAWVRERNAQSQAVLQARPEYTPTRDAVRRILDAKERIPQITRRGEWLYNLWQDADHKRGLWRRTTLDEYRRAQPAWDTVLDLDALADAEGENWVWAGAHALATDPSRCLVFLSRGGADAHVMREFDAARKAFVDGGFMLPEAKSRVDWEDRDTLLVATDFGPGSMSDSGYPLVYKRWRRGTSLDRAEEVFRAEAGDMAAWASVDLTPGHEHTVFSRSLDFYRQHYTLVRDGDARRLDVPVDAQIAIWSHAGRRAETLLIELRSDLDIRLDDRVQHWRAGSLLAIGLAAFQAGERGFESLFEPTGSRSLAGFTTTREHLILHVLDNVSSRLEEWRRDDGPEGTVTFERRPIEAPHPGTLGIASLADPMLADDPLAGAYLLSFTDFLTPSTLSLARAGTDEREALKALPPMFDAAGMRVEQLFATSRDGTRVPYFVVWPRGVDATRPADGSTPTLLYGYGGFEVSMQPWYSAAWGSAWLARGGAVVVANIRGGGEFGPAWHQAAIRENKQRSYDDFIAVAEDLIARRITSPARLGIEGGSNGGLLMGAMLTQRPDLFGAVLCQVPLLDMRRYHLLLAGASWVAEYGNPDVPDDWAFISAYSPYQRLQRAARYPSVFFTTSTRDDRVHPGHARKMAARMLEFGQDVLYFENIEGGHGGAADNEQRAHMQALEISYLWKQLGAPVQAAADEPLEADARRVLDFWFGAPDSSGYGDYRDWWFRKSDATDRDIVEQFAPLIERGLRGELAAWSATPRGALAQILVLDQFTRNAFRDTPRAFAGDSRALAAATEMVGRRQDVALPAVLRSFAYMPFEHAEGLGAQDEAVRLFTRLSAEGGDAHDMLGYAVRHRDVIRRFGRFPHRNEVLGRRSTGEEEAFLREPGSRF